MKAPALSGAWSVGSLVRGLSVSDPRVAVLDTHPRPGMEMRHPRRRRHAPCRSDQRRSADAVSRVWPQGGRRRLPQMISDASVFNVAQRE